MATDRYQHALERNLAELQKALLIRETLIGIYKHRYTTNVFIRIVAEALENEYIAHAIKVLDRNRKSSSFWYIYRTYSKPIGQYAQAKRYSIDRLSAVADKLKLIRDRTHFHIDSQGVLDPDAIWHSASLTGNELAAGLDFAWGALCVVQESLGGDTPSLLDYTSADALAALQRIDGVNS